MTLTRVRPVYLGLGLATVLCASCNHNDNAMKTVTTRAAFDLECPPEQLKLTVLDTEGVRKRSSQIGAEGCGEQGVYVYYAFTNTWLSNSGVKPGIPQATDIEETQEEPQEQSDAESPEESNDAALEPSTVDAQSADPEGADE